MNPTSSPSFQVRQMAPAETAGGLRLSTFCGWNQLPEDWRFVQARTPAGCFVAEAAGEVVGTAMTVAYPPDTAWIAMVLVHPDWRRHGVGTALFKAVMDANAHCPVLRLDATPMGQPLYERCGFRTEFVLRRMLLDAPAVPPPQAPPLTGVRSLQAEDVSQIEALDALGFGVPRGDVLLTLRGRAPEYALLTSGTQPAFCLGRHGRILDQLGPVAAGDVGTALALVAQALAQRKERAVVIDVPEAQTGFAAALETMGFHEQRRMTRMRCGPPPQTVCPATLFAIAGPDLG